MATVIGNDSKNMTWSPLLATTVRT